MIALETVLIVAACVAIVALLYRRERGRLFAEWFGRTREQIRALPEIAERRRKQT